MPQYRNANDERAARLDKESEAAFDAGNHARDVGDEYVRVTVLLAVALFLTALSQRFDIRPVRLGIIGLALLVLTYSLFDLATRGGRTAPLRGGARQPIRDRPRSPDRCR